MCLLQNRKKKSIHSIPSSCICILSKINLKMVLFSYFVFIFALFVLYLLLTLCVIIASLQYTTYVGYYYRENFRLHRILKNWKNFYFWTKFLKVGNRKRIHLRLVFQFGSQIFYYGLKNSKHGSQISAYV